MRPSLLKHHQAASAFFGTVASDPLHVIQKECLARNLCDEKGFRKPEAHWVVSIAHAPDDPTQPPNLKTVGVQRVSKDGIDFCTKKNTAPSYDIKIDKKQPMSILHVQGRHVPGETTEQWRGEGYCEPIPLNSVINALPNYTITNMVSAKRLEEELRNEANNSEEKRINVDNKKCHLTEIVQQTRAELEKGEIGIDEIENSIAAFRFYPQRLECISGGPETITWDRYEWTKEDDGMWKEAKAVLPH